MSYSLFSGKRILGQIASGGGMSDVDAVDFEDGSPLANFLEEGTSDNPSALAENISTVLSARNDLSDSVREVLKAILSLLPKKGIVLIG